MIIYGASGHGKVILDNILSNKGYQKITFIDDNPSHHLFCNHKLVHPSSITIDKEPLIIAIGNNQIRKKIAEKVFMCNFFNAIHKSAIISNTSSIGIGNAIMPNTVINHSTKIGNHTIINSGSIIEHDCNIENFTHISPNASIAGNVIIGEGTQVGIGACIIQGTIVGKWSIIGAGAVIIKDVPDFSIVVGNPGKVIKQNNNGTK